jgi:Tfp pilus assembly protein PilO
MPVTSRPVASDKSIDKAKKGLLGLQGKLRIDPHYRYAASVIAVGVVGSLVLAIVVVKPLVSKLVSDTKDLNNKRIESSDLKTKIGDLKTLKVNYDKLGESNRSKILVALPTDGDAGHLLAVIEMVGAQTGSQVVSVMPSGAGTAASSSQTGATSDTAASSSQSYAVKIVVRGDYASALEFIVALEKAPRIMDVTSVSFSGTSNPLETSISVNAYYQSAGGSS